VTVSVGSEHEEMIGVAEEALARAIHAVKINGPISDVGAVVEKYVRSMGFRPIRNLTGHQIAPYTVHAGVSIPNVSEGLGGFGGRFQPWSIYALEPFVTLPDARGIIQGGGWNNSTRQVKRVGSWAEALPAIYGSYRTSVREEVVDGKPGAEVAEAMLGGGALRYRRWSRSHQRSRGRDTL
jgi:hypothetical protein